MFCNRKRKADRGFILIYVLLIGCICIFISLGCFNMEMNVRSNNLNDYKKCLKMDVTEKYREYLLTELNRYLNENISFKEGKLNENMSSLNNLRIYFEECYIYYDEKNDCFKVEYVFNGKFYKEEVYEYQFGENGLVYSCVDYSLDEGG